MKKYILTLICSVIFAATVNAAETISFTWTGATGSKNFVIRATAGKGFMVEWGNGRSDVFTGAGSANVTAAHTYGSTGTYTVTITAGDAQTFLTSLDVSARLVSWAVPFLASSYAEGAAKSSIFVLHFQNIT